MTKISRFCSFLISICQNTNFEGNLGGSTIRDVQVLGKLTLKIRQHITCKSRNIIYLVTCAKCKLQGVGHSTQFGKRISNYFSHIKSGTHDCKISCHFIDCHQDTWISDYRINTDFQLRGIAQLQNPPRNKKDLEQRLRDFEGYWQVELGTVQPHGLNFRNELNESFFKNSK